MQKLKILESCKDQRISTKIGESQRSAAEIDVSQRFLKTAKINNSRPTVAKIEDL